MTDSISPSDWFDALNSLTLYHIDCICVKIDRNKTDRANDTGSEGFTMFREIKKKKLILENRKPYNSEVMEYLDEMNRTDWIYSSLRLDGSCVQRQNVEHIVKGEFQTEVTINDHASIGRYEAAIRYAYDMVEMKMDLTMEYLLQFHRILSGNPNAVYRRSNPILVMLSYNPPFPSEIAEQIEILFHWLGTADFEGNPILRATHLHHRLIEIYPFEQESEAVARMAMYYELIRNGYPPILLGINESEYYTMIHQYIKKEEIKPFYDAVERGVFNKLELMMQLTATQNV